MEDKKNEKENTGNKGIKISRKEALKKAGYAAFSAATMMLLLNDPVRANSASPVLPPGDDDWDGEDGWG